MKPDASEWLGRFVEVRIDRPLGSAHPRYADIVYPVNYGEVQDDADAVARSMAAESVSIDAYVLGPESPITACSGRVVAIVHRLDNIEYRLVVATTELSWTAEAVMKAVFFQEQYFETLIEMPGAVANRVYP